MKLDQENCLFYVRLRGGCLIIPLISLFWRLTRLTNKPTLSFSLVQPLNRRSVETIYPFRPHLKYSLRTLNPFSPLSSQSLFGAFAGWRWRRRRPRSLARSSIGKECALSLSAGSIPKIRNQLRIESELIYCDKESIHFAGFHGEKNMAKMH